MISLAPVNKGNSAARQPQSHVCRVFGLGWRQPAFALRLCKPAPAAPDSFRAMPGPLARQTTTPFLPEGEVDNAGRGLGIALKPLLPLLFNAIISLFLLLPHGGNEYNQRGGDSPYELPDYGLTSERGYLCEGWLPLGQRLRCGNRHLHGPAVRHHCMRSGPMVRPLRTGQRYLHSMEGYSGDRRRDDSCLFRPACSGAAQAKKRMF